MNTVALPVLPADQQGVCDRCRQCLSLGVVMINLTNGETLCGECVTSDEQIGFQPSVFGLVALENVIFPCRNHIGCRNFFPYNKICKHDELEAVYHVCHFCHNYEENDEVALLLHLNRFHSFVKRDPWHLPTIQDGFCDGCVFYENNNILFVTLRVVNKYVKITCRCSVPTDARYKIIFCDEATSLETPPINKSGELVFYLDILKDCILEECSIKIKSVDASSTSILEYNGSLNLVDYLVNSLFHVRPLKNIAAAFPSEYLDCALDKLRSDFTFWISEGSRDSRICAHCKYDTGEVAISDIGGLHWSCQPCMKQKIHQPRSHLLRCDWEGCFLHTSVCDFLTHKRDCKYRRYKCPDAQCIFIGLKEALINHWHLTSLIVAPIIPVKLERHFYWLNTRYNELFYVQTTRVPFNRNNIFSCVRIEYIDVVMDEYKCIPFRVSHRTTAGLPVEHKVFAMKQPTKFVQYLQIRRCSRYSLRMTFLANNGFRRVSRW